MEVIEKGKLESGYYCSELGLMCFLGVVLRLEDSFSELEDLEFEGWLWSMRERGVEDSKFGWLGEWELW